MYYQLSSNVLPPVIVECLDGVTIAVEAVLLSGARLRALLRVIVPYFVGRISTGLVQSNFAKLLSILPFTFVGVVFIALVLVREGVDT